MTRSALRGGTDELLQQRQQLRLTAWPDAIDKLRLVLCDHLLQPAQQRVTLGGEMQRGGAAVALDGAAFGEPALLEAIEQRHEIGSPDAQGSADLGLPQTGITLQNFEHAELRRADVLCGKPLVEISEDDDLRSAESIADQIGQQAKFDWVVDLGR